MKHISTYKSFLNESLNSYEMDIAKKAMAAEFARLGIKDVRINTDMDTMRYVTKELKSTYETDKLIRVEFGTKTGKCEDAVDRMDDVLKAFEKVGWFPAEIRVTYGKWIGPKSDIGLGLGKMSKEYKTVADAEFPKDTRTISFILDPIYDDKVKPVDRTFWHITKKENVPSIMSKGLLPKTHSKRTYYPQRIFLATTRYNAEFIMPEIKREDPGEYVVLKVKVPENIQVYKDTRFKNAGVYVLNPIAPENISVADAEQKQAA
jgi:hypothetical protein